MKRLWSAPESAAATALWIDLPFRQVPNPNRRRRALPSRSTFHIEFLNARYEQSADRSAHSKLGHYPDRNLL